MLVKSLRNTMILRSMDLLVSGQASCKALALLVQEKVCEMLKGAKERCCKFPVKQPKNTNFHTV